MGACCASLCTDVSQGRSPQRRRKCSAAIRPVNVISSGNSGSEPAMARRITNGCSAEATGGNLRCPLPYASAAWRTSVPSASRCDHGQKGSTAPLNHDFEFLKDADLNTQIAAFAAAHQSAHDELLAMDGRRSLGPGKVRVTFRVRPKNPERRERR